MTIDRPRMFDHLEGKRYGERLIFLGNYLMEIDSESDMSEWMYRYGNVSKYLQWLAEKDKEYAHD